MAEENGIPTRVRVLEVRIEGINEKLDKVDGRVEGFEKAWSLSQQGLSRTEKIALTGAGSAVVAAIIAAIALISGSAP